jgi:hypothetical protein
MVSRDTILGKLPPFKDEWILLHPDQSVKDIIAEVLNGHEDFADDYDKIALCFDDDDTDKVCATLYDFCKSNLQYIEEKEEEQTVASPGALLSRGHCDCKGYSNFIGGVLSALNRNGKKIKWNYRFASYDFINKNPHHVFIVVHNDNDEIWIDPTPGATAKQPVWQVDKKINDMALYKISGMGEDYEENIIGLVVGPYSGNTINYDGSGKYNGVFGPYLGLSAYAEYESSSGTDWNQLAQQINTAIQNGPSPGHTVQPDFVQWVFDSNIRSWNFFYPNGVVPGFTAEGILPVGWPHPVITDDGRLTFDHDVKVDDYRNAEIHVLTAWLQSLINQYDGSPYPLKPRAVKEFSQNYTGNPGNTNANLFSEARGTGLIKDVLKTINDTINVVKAGVLKIYGVVPRNEFLILVGLNVFNLAHNMQEHINNGAWDEIAKKWRSIGGNPDKLLSTIQSGADKPAILGAVIGVFGIDDVAEAIAGAAPIIAIFLSYANKDGKYNDVIAATQAGLETKYPGVDWSFLGDSLHMDGTPVQWTVDPADDENSPYYTARGTSFLDSTPFGGTMTVGKMLLIGGGLTAAYFIFKPKRKKVSGSKENTIVLVGLGVGLILLMKKKTEIVPVTDIEQVALPYSQPAQLEVSTSDDVIQADASLIKPYLTEFDESKPVTNELATSY